MTQRLKLIKHEKQGKSHFSLYRFGLTETLLVHSDGNADICDRDSGHCIRPLGWDGIKNMGPFIAFENDRKKY